MKLKYIDLYAGIGGFRSALDNLGNTCVFSAEIDSHALQTYEKNYNDKAAFDLDSIKEMSNEEIDKEIPNHDLLVGGFPCQPFSVAGNRKGFKTEDTKGTQFFNILKIIDVKKPKYLLLENVKHLFTHDGGKTWKIIKNQILERGYKIPDKEIILSPSDFGIPQNRKRVFIVAFKDSKPRNFIFSKTKLEDMEEILEKSLKNKNYVIDNELENVLKAWDEFVKNIIFPIEKTLPVIWIDEMISNDEIPNDMIPWRQKYLRDMRELYKKNKIFIDEWIDKYDVLKWKKRDKKLEWQVGKNNRNIKDSIITLRQSGIRCKAKPIFPTLVAMVQTPIIFDSHLNKFRFISPREAANLQSFPKNFILNPNDHQAYKQLGNAVNVKIVKELAKFYFNE